VHGVFESRALVISVLVLLGGAIFGAIFIKPILTLSSFPYTDFNFTFLRGVGTLTIHLTQLPPSFIFTSVWPLEHTLALLVIVYVLTLIFATIRPGEHAITMHLIMLPITLKLSSILPGIGTMPMDIIFQEITFVVIAVIPSEATFTLLDAILVVAGIR
jgi:hypothetical protein